MPSPKKPLKRDLLKQELADKLRVDVADILERDEAAEALGYKNEKTLSNQKESAPCFYRADLGTHGLALYLRGDLIKWRDDPDYRREMDKLGKEGRPYPWPETQIAAAVANPTTKAFLDELTDDEDYKGGVLGLKP